MYPKNIMVTIQQVPTNDKILTTNEDQIVYEKDYDLSNNSLLNKPDHHATAAISCRLSFASQLVWNRKENKIDSFSRHIAGAIAISDCSRSITLNIDCGYHDGDTDNAIYKIDSLLTELQKCKENLLRMKDDLTLFDKFTTELGKEKRYTIGTFEEFKNMANGNERTDHENIN